MKRRAAEEAQKARLEREKKEVDVEEDGEAKLKEEDQQDGKVEDVTDEEERKEAKEEKTGGNNILQSNQQIFTLKL